MTDDHSAADRLTRGLDQLGLGSGKGPPLLAYAGAVLESNKRTNLVGAKDLGGLVLQILDALAPLAGRELAEPIVDVGSGAGLPGLAAAIMYPRLQFVLLEPRAKRAAFLDATCVALAISNAVVRKLTAHAAATGPMRASFGTALARALAKPPAAIELALPLLRPGGTLLLYLGRHSRPTSGELRTMHGFGGALEEATAVAVPYLDAARHVWAIRKGTGRARTAKAQ